MSCTNVRGVLGEIFIAIFILLIDLMILASAVVNTTLSFGSVPTRQKSGALRRVSQALG